MIEITPFADEGLFNLNGAATLTYDMYPSDWPVAPGEMHFRLVEPQLGTLDLGCGNGYVVREYSLGSPEIREVTYNNSLDDGTYDLTQFIGARAVTLDIVLRNTASIDGTGPIVKAESQMRDDVLKFLHPGRRPVLIFSEHGDNRCRQIQLRGTEFGWTVSKPRFNSLNLSWKAPKGIIESLGDACVTVSYKESLPSTILLDINNPGTVSSTWTMRTQGQLIDPVFQLGSERLSLDYNAGPTDIVTVDSFTKTVSINGVPTGYKYLNDDSDWFKIPPGRSTLEIAHSGVALAGYPFAKWEVLANTPVAGTSRLVMTDPSAYIETPDAANLDLTGNIEAIVHVSPTSWTSYSGWLLYKDLAYRWNYTGSTQSSSFQIWNGTAWRAPSSYTQNVALSGSTPYWLRVFYDNTNKTTSYYYSAQPASTAVGSLAWTIFGTGLAHAGGSPVASTAPLTVGAPALPLTFPGTYRYVQVKSGATAIVDLDLRSAAPGTTTVADVGGHVFTLRSSARIEADVVPPPAGTTLWSDPPHQASPGTPPWSWSTEVLNPPTTWTSSVAYPAGSLVWYNSATYKANIAIAAGQSPPGANVNWIQPSFSDWQFATIIVQLCYKPSWI